jgi:histone H3/H4
MEFTLEPMRTLMKKHGAKRVSDKACEALSDVLEKKTKLLLEQSDRLSKHAGRRTVLRRDVKMAKKVLEK